MSFGELHVNADLSLPTTCINSFLHLVHSSWPGFHGACVVRQTAQDSFNQIGRLATPAFDCSSHAYGNWLP